MSDSGWVHHMFPWENLNQKAELRAVSTVQYSEVWVYWDTYCYSQSKPHGWVNSQSLGRSWKDERAKRSRYEDHLIFGTGSCQTGTSSEIAFCILKLASLWCPPAPMELRWNFGSHQQPNEDNSVLISHSFRVVKEGSKLLVCGHAQLPVNSRSVGAQAYSFKKVGSSVIIWDEDIPKERPWM